MTLTEVKSKMLAAAKSIAVMYGYDNYDVYVTITSPIKEDFPLNDEEIIALVCKRYKVPKELVLAKSRVQPFCIVRQICFYMVYRFCKMSTVQIGNKYEWNHATILYGNKVIRDQIEISKKFRDEINGVIDLLSKAADVKKNGENAN